MPSSNCAQTRPDTIGQTTRNSTQNAERNRLLNSADGVMVPPRGAHNFKSARPTCFCAGVLSGRCDVIVGSRCGQPAMLGNGPWLLPQVLAQDINADHKDPARKGEQQPVKKSAANEDDRCRCVTQERYPTSRETGTERKRRRRDHEDSRHLEGIDMHDVVGELACEGHSECGERRIWRGGV